MSVRRRVAPSGNGSPCSASSLTDPMPRTVEIRRLGKAGTSGLPERSGCGAPRGSPAQGAFGGTACGRRRLRAGIVHRGQHTVHAGGPSVLWIAGLVDQLGTQPTRSVDQPSGVRPQAM